MLTLYQTITRCQVIALAVERFRLNNDRLPTDLVELMPDYLKAIPIDQFDGKPLKYVNRGMNYSVYGVGMDGIDDGGVTDDRGGREPGTDTTFVIER